MVLKNTNTFISFKTGLRKNKIKKKTIRTLITFASHPSCFTPSVTMTCEPVTRIGIVTIHAASAHAILTIVAKLTLCNFFWTLRMLFTHGLSIIFNITFCICSNHKKYLYKDFFDKLPIFFFFKIRN